MKNYWVYCGDRKYRKVKAASIDKAIEAITEFGYMGFVAGSPWYTPPTEACA